MTQPIERLSRAHFVGPAMVVTSGVAGSNYVAAGRTTLAAGSATQVVSTTAINSDSLVLVTTTPSSLTTGQNSGGQVVVNSIVSGVSFNLSAATGTAFPFNNVCMWEIKLTS